MYMTEIELLSREHFRILFLHFRIGTDNRKEIEHIKLALSLDTCDHEDIP